LSIDLRGLKDQFRQVRKALQDHGNFLPATLDEPPEEPQPHDYDKIEDDTNFDMRNLCVNVEPVSENGSSFIDPGPMMRSAERSVFTYFLDGSIRTYYLGEQVEGSRAYPVMASEVASAIVRRKADGRTDIASFKRRICLLVPPRPPMSDDTWNELVKLKDSFDRSSLKLKLELVPLEREEHREGVDLRTSLAGKARSVMHDLEHESAIDLQRTEGNWLIIDGAIRKAKFLGLKETIGLAKSFSRKPVFSIDGRKPRDVVSLLAGLKEGSRTIVFKHSVQREEAEDPVKRAVAFWYLRLRGGRGLQGPLQGIVKIDFHLPEDLLQKEHFDTVNSISRALMAEKYVSPYPTPRWHAHIYPIFVAENYIKSSMYSPIVFRGYFR